MEKLTNIVLKVSPDKARYFMQLDDEEKEIIANLVSSWLKEGGFDLKGYMDYMGNRAQMNGLTPEVFAEIMSENNH